MNPNLGAAKERMKEMLPISDPQPLPWERTDGPPDGVGICLSGGGLRAAAFSLGVMQILQEERSLLQGPASADYLAAVSGGSYIAGAFTLGARQQARNARESDGRFPLSEGSPEERHILAHGRYLLQNPVRTGFRLVGFGILNLASLVMLFVWAGTLLADLAVGRSIVLSPLNVPLQMIDRLPLAVLLPALIIGVIAMIRGIFADGRRRIMTSWLSGWLVLVITCQPVLEAARREEAWWSRQSMSGIILLLLAVLVVGAVISAILRHRGAQGLVPAVFNALNFVIPRLLGFVLLAWSAVTWSWVLSPVLAENVTIPELVTAIVLFFSSLVFGALFAYIPHRASLHREYRQHLESCFSIERKNASTVTQVIGTLLSDSASPRSGPMRFPRLLICATANVHVKIRGRRQRSFVPFVFSHDVCGVPGHPGVSFPTRKLELGREPAGLVTRKTEPLVSLFTAIAATGAAVSPSMGRYTVPSARAVLVALNIRLGRWLPNPFSSRLRNIVSASTTPGHFDEKWNARLGRGYNEMVPELLGVDGPRVYVSDGGHYDNLGLLALLRARCAEIWCVDAEADRTGQARELRRVLAIAKEELNVIAHIDTSVFTARSDNLYDASHTIGTLSYPGGFEGRLVVVKLGLTRDSPEDLHTVRASDSRFPHHPTLNQIYSPDRMDAYRRLGRNSTLRCLGDLRTSQTSGRFEEPLRPVGRGLRRLVESVE